jgi:hypothetical protein
MFSAIRNKSFASDRAHAAFQPVIAISLIFLWPISCGLKTFFPASKKNSPTSICFVSPIPTFFPSGGHPLCSYGFRP